MKLHTVDIENAGMYLRVFYVTQADGEEKQVSHYRIYNVGAEHAYRMQRDILHWLADGIVPAAEQAPSVD